MEKADDADILSSRSGTRPRPKTTDETRDTTLEQSHILTVNEFVKADQKVSSVREFYEHLSERVSKMRDYLLAYPSILPVEGRLSCLMGERDNPFGGRKKEFHSGLDIAVPRGTDVKATGKGRVIFSGRRSLWISVIIDHGFDIKTYYAHNSKLGGRGGHSGKGPYNRQIRQHRQEHRSPCPLRGKDKGYAQGSFGFCVKFR